jgi:hypothetical protein
MAVRAPCVSGPVSHPPAPHDVSRRWASPVPQHRVARVAMAEQGQQPEEVRPSSLQRQGRDRAQARKGQAKPAGDAVQRWRGARPSCPVHTTARPRRPAVSPSPHSPPAASPPTPPPRDRSLPPQATDPTNPASPTSPPRTGAALQRERKRTTTTTTRSQPHTESPYSHHDATRPAARHSPIQNRRRRTRLVTPAATAAAAAVAATPRAAAVASAVATARATARREPRHF